MCMRAKKIVLQSVCTSLTAWIKVFGGVATSIREGEGDCLTKVPVALLTNASSGTLVDTARFGEALIVLENVVTECRDLWVRSKSERIPVSD